MADLNRLENCFASAMRETCVVAQQNGYRPSVFIGMLSQFGGVGAAKRLLQTSEAQPGLTRLWELGLLHLSVEAHVIREKWAALFTESEKAEALRRLEAHGYQPPD